MQTREYRRQTVEAVLDAMEGRGQDHKIFSSSKQGRAPRRAPVERRIFVSNISYEMKWQEIKDLFRDKVGDVSYVKPYQGMIN